MIGSAPPIRQSSRARLQVIAESLASVARRRRRRRRARIRIAQLTTIALLLGIWQLAGTHLLDPFFYSTPVAVWQRLVEWFTVGTPFGSIWEQIMTTLQEAVIGLVIGGIAGVAFGLVVGASRVLSEFLGPFVSIANTVPRIVLATLFFIWFGLGMSSKVATVVVMVFFAVFFETFRGVQQVDVRMIQEAELLGVGFFLRIRTIYVPVAADRINAGLRSAVGLAWIGAIVAEFIGARKGLGLLVHNAQATFDAAGIIAGMIVITAIALAGDSVLTGIARATAAKM